MILLWCHTGCDRVRPDLAMHPVYNCHEVFVLRRVMGNIGELESELESSRVIEKVRPSKVEGAICQ